MGFDLEGIDGTLELLAHQAAGVTTEFFRLEEFRVTTEKRLSGPPVSEASLKLNIGGRHCASVAHNAGPVHAIDDCLRQSLAALFPAIRVVQLTDYKVRVLGASRGTASRCEVLVVSTDGERSWTTVGISENILDASWQALADSYRLWLTRESLREPAVRQAAHDYCWGV
jgi:2-isopropylmalate synthase